MTINPFPLTPNKLYYFRSYVVTPIGTVYSPQVSGTTKQIGVTTLTYSSATTPTLATGFVIFTAAATNPAQLPLADVLYATSTGTPAFAPGITVTFTTPALTGSIGTGTHPAIGSIATSANFNNIAVNIDKQYRQSNAPYTFTAKAVYGQGSTGHNLIVTSSQVSYTIPKVNVGDQVFGGTAVATSQYGNPNNGVSTNYITYTGVTKVLVLASADSYTGTGGSTTYVFKGSPTGGSAASSVAANPPITGSYTGWRLPTLAEFEKVHAARWYDQSSNNPSINKIGTAGSSLSSTVPNTSEREYWTDSSYPPQSAGSAAWPNYTVDFQYNVWINALSFESFSAFGSPKRVRSVRLNSNAGV